MPAGLDRCTPHEADLSDGWVVAKLRATRCWRKKRITHMVDVGTSVEDQAHAVEVTAISRIDEDRVTIK